MATSSQLREWWEPYRCNATMFVRVAFPGDAQVWELWVAEQAAPLWARFAEVMADHNYLFLESAGGTYNCRKIANSDAWSLHSYGLAIDLNPSANPYGLPLRYDYPADFITDIEAITTNGLQAFQWGGRWSTPDSMHWQVNVAPTDIEGDDMEAVIKALQEQCNAGGFAGPTGKPLKVDGVLGLNTQFALNALASAAALNKNALSKQRAAQLYVRKGKAVHIEDEP